MSGYLLYADTCSDACSVCSTQQHHVACRIEACRPDSTLPFGVFESVEMGARRYDARPEVTRASNTGKTNYCTNVQREPRGSRRSAVAPGFHAFILLYTVVMTVCHRAVEFCRNSNDRGELMFAFDQEAGSLLWPQGGSYCCRTGLHRRNISSMLFPGKTHKLHAYVVNCIHGGYPPRTQNFFQHGTLSLSNDQEAPDFRGKCLELSR